MNMKFYSAEENGKMNYAVFYPDNYENLPLTVYLHGAGERGRDFDIVYRHAIPKLIKAGKEFDAIVLVPQCPLHVVWNNIVFDLKEIIDSVVSEFAVKADRISISGSSMGGYGTWMMGLTYPDFFSAMGPIAGGGMAWRAINLRTTPIYAMHGSDDTVVLPVCSEMLCNNVNASGGNAKYVVLDGMGHSDGISYAYENTDLIEWLISQRRTACELVSPGMI